MKISSTLCCKNFYLMMYQFQALCPILYNCIKVGIRGPCYNSYRVVIIVDKFEVHTPADLFTIRPNANDVSVTYAL